MRFCGNSGNLPWRALFGRNVITTITTYFVNGREQYCTYSQYISTISLLLVKLISLYLTYYNEYKKTFHSIKTGDSGKTGRPFRFSGTLIPLETGHAI